MDVTDYKKYWNEQWGEIHERKAQEKASLLVQQV